MVISACRAYRHPSEQLPLVRGRRIPPAPLPPGCLRRPRSRGCDEERLAWSSCPCGPRGGGRSLAALRWAGTSNGPNIGAPSRFNWLAPGPIRWDTSSKQTPWALERVTLVKTGKVDSSREG